MTFLSFMVAWFAISTWFVMFFFRVLKVTVDKNTLITISVALVDFWTETECVAVLMLYRSFQKRCFLRAYSSRVWTEAVWVSCRGSWRLWTLRWRAGGDT